MAANLQSVVQYWRKFDLPQLQRDLDVAATEIANRQDESDSSRKKLVELSREFKKATTEDTRKVVAPLLKSFQVEIDNLSKRSKASEAAFLSVYKKIIDVPDPMPVLEYCDASQQKMMRIQDLEIENKQLRETLNDYNEEFKEVKNQDVTIKQLRERIRELEHSIESAVTARTKERENEVQRLCADQDRHLQEQQMTFSKKLDDADKRVTSLQSALESTQSELLDLKAKYDEESRAKSDEMEIVMNDLERANQRATLAEKEVSQLKEQLTAAHKSLQLADQIQKAPDMEQAINILTCSSLEMELNAKEKEISQLINDIQQLQSTISKMKESSASQIAQLEEKLEEKNKIIERLEDKLNAQKDYDEIKRELNILKSVEFSGCAEAGADGATSQQQPKSLEMLLLEKNRSLQAENTSLKVTNSDVQGRYENLLRDYETAVQSAAHHKELVAQLEADLLNVQTLPSRFRGEGEGEARNANQLPAEILFKAVQGAAASSSEQAGMDSLLPIVSSQRERFRQRIIELEDVNHNQQQQMHVLQATVDKLQEDNVKLYEKIRFLQTYPSSKQSDRSDETMHRYSRKYEEHLDPFASFGRDERLRRYQSLSPFEKVTFTMGRVILNSKVARTFTLAYGILLHCLVFLVLYKLANTEICKRDQAALCAESYAAHMQDIHGETLQGFLHD